MDSGKFRKILKMAVEEGASDLMFAVGEKPLWKFGKLWNEIRSDALEEQDTELLAAITTGEELDDDFKSAEVAYEAEGVGRFRASVFKQRGSFRIVMRVIPIEERTFKDLNLPDEATEISELQRGLVLATGATGQGKSTTLSAIIDQINRKRRAHIITIEDPIEFTYRKRRAVITQREIGEDVKSFSKAIREALRQQPDVIMVGEIRNAKTFEAVLTAAETGHLVLSAIHTADVMTTLDRILSYYRNRELQSARERLANNLEAIISLRLLPCAHQDMRCELVPAVELLRNTPTIAACLRQNKLPEITGHIERGREPYGMRTFNQDIAGMYKRGWIDEKTALTYAGSQDELKREFILDGKTSY